VPTPGGPSVSASDSVRAPIHSNRRALSTTCGKTRSGGAEISIVCSLRCRGRSLGGLVGHVAHLLGRGLAFLMDAFAHRLELVRGRRAGRRGPRHRSRLGPGGRRLRGRRWLGRLGRLRRLGRHFGPLGLGKLLAKLALPRLGQGSRRRRKSRASIPDERDRCAEQRACSEDGISIHRGHSSTIKTRRARGAVSLYSDDFLPRPAPPVPERREQTRPLQTVGRRNREL